MIYSSLVCQLLEISEDDMASRYFLSRCFLAWSLLGGRGILPEIKKTSKLN
jgi:hypothetical protein